MILSHHPDCSTLPSQVQTALSSTLQPFNLQVALLHPDPAGTCQHVFPLSPLAATLMDPPASVANKRLTACLSSLDATLTKNRGGPASRHSDFRHSDARLSLFCRFLHQECFTTLLQSALPHSFSKMPGCMGGTGYKSIKYYLNSIAPDPPLRL